MKSSIVYASNTGNTKALAEKINEIVGDVQYIGKPNEEAMQSETIYVGFWTAKYTCTADIEEFLKGLSNKKVVLFGTAGYDNTQEFFDKIMDTVAVHINDTNTILGRFMCQGKVSEGKKQQLQKMDENKYEQMKQKISEGDNKPDEDSFKALASFIDKLK